MLVHSRGEVICCRLGQVMQSPESESKVSVFFHLLDYPKKLDVARRQAVKGKVKSIVGACMHLWLMLLRLRRSCSSGDVLASGGDILDEA